MGNQLVQLLIQESPALVALARSAFAKANPGAPVPTSEEVVAAYAQLFADSNARDEALRAALLAEMDAPPKMQ